MKQVMSFACTAMLFVAVGGCGGSGEPSSMIENADQTAIDAYDAAIAEEENMMNDEPPPEE